MSFCSDVERELDAAALSRRGLSASEVALALALREPGQGYDELAAMARRRVTEVKNFMRRRGLFATARARG